MDHTYGLILTLPWPPSTNTYYRFVPGLSSPKISKKGREYRKRVKAAVVDICGADIQPFTTPVHVLVDLYPPDKRVRDLDNHDGKALFDALTKAGVWTDDSLVKSRWGRMHEKVKYGQCIVTIEEIAEGNTQ